MRVRGAALLGVVLGVVLGVGGCTLVDQNTFNPHAGDAPVVPPAKVVAAVVEPGPPPLVVIGTADPAAYGDALRRAVAQARARKADVAFDVVEMQPPDSIGEVGARAGAVARMIVGQGVAAERVRLAVRPLVGALGEVRVFVR